GVHPDEAVACGAAIQAHLLSSGSREMLLLDVTPHNLGIMVAGGLFDRIIEKDTTIPTSAKKTFTTVRHDQTQVRIVVLQGDAKQASENELLGEFVLDGLRKAKQGDVKLEVTFDITADGIVSVSARDVETGRAQAITVTAGSGLTPDEIAKMTMENREDEVVAGASAAFEQERFEAERTLREIDKLLPEARAVIDGTEFGADALRKASETVQAARDAMARRDAEAVARARPALERTRSMLTNVLQRLRK
ncbi:MAG: Hsp70 family protein, partial [Myxococcota bacterium]